MSEFSGDKIQPITFIQMGFPWIPVLQLQGFQVFPFKLWDWRGEKPACAEASIGEESKIGEEPRIDEETLIGEEPPIDEELHRDEEFQMWFVSSLFLFFLPQIIRA